jgi:hypothetical protein
MAENWTHLANVADDLCFFRGCTVDSVNHPTAMYQMNCGNRFGGDPGIGAWVNYGLGSPILDLTPPVGISEARQCNNLDLIAKLNSAHAAQHPGHDELAARMDNYELAFRMPMQVPETLDLLKEDAKTKERYGIGNDATDSFGRKALLARKLIEKGVRFVQLYNCTWDSHD